MKKAILPLLISTTLLASCGQQAPISQNTNNSEFITDNPASSSAFYYEPDTGKLTKINPSESLTAQGFSMSGCLFYIDLAHMSSDVPGAVKVNGRGTCPTSKDAYSLSVTMILEKCNDSQGVFCYQYKTGKTTSRTMTSVKSGSWGTGDINSFTPCTVSSYYRGRLRFQATNAQGVSIAVPLVDPVGNVNYVRCPYNP